MSLSQMLEPPHVWWLLLSIASVALVFGGLVIALCYESAKWRERTDERLKSLEEGAELAKLVRVGQSEWIYHVGQRVSQLEQPEPPLGIHTQRPAERRRIDMRGFLKRLET